MSTLGTVSSYITSNLVNKLTSVATAGDTTVLTSTSDRFQYFTGTAAQTVTLPVTSTLVAGYTFHIINESTGAVTVQTSGANTLVVLGSGYRTVVTCALASGTGTSSWTYTVVNNSFASSPVVLDSTAVPTWPTAPTTGGVWYGDGTKAVTDSTSVVLGNGATKLLASTNCIVIGNNARSRGPGNSILGAYSGANSSTLTNITTLGTNTAKSHFNLTQCVAIGINALLGIEFTATFAGSVMTVTSSPFDLLMVGMEIYTSGPGTYDPAASVLQCTINAYLTAGGSPTYTVSTPTFTGGPFTCIAKQSSLPTTSCVAIGLDSMSKATGSSNTAVGVSSLQYGRGDKNTAVGYFGLGSSFGSNNTAIGYSAIGGQTIIGGQVFTQSGTTITSTVPAFISDLVGGFVAVNSIYVPVTGYISPTQLTAGTSQIIPSGGQQIISAGSDNVAVGQQAMIQVKSSRNVAVGSDALYGYNDNINTGNCVAVGYQSLYSSGNGGDHTAVGYLSATNLAYGNRNIAIGDKSMQYVQHGVDNVVMGSSAQAGAYFAWSGIAGSVMTVTSVTSGSIYIGMKVSDVAGSTVGLSTPATAFTVTSFGTGTGGVGTYGVSIVSRAAGSGYGFQDVPLTGITAIGARALSVNGRSNNTAVGYQSLMANTTGANNVAVGFQAANSNSSGSNNTAMGSLALFGNKTGDNNTSVGCQAGTSNQSGSNNTSVGYSSLSANTTGNNNTAVGSSALLSNTTGLFNTAMGYQSIQSRASGVGNAGFGYATLRAVTSGSQNTAIGTGALQFATTANNTVAVGSNALNNALSAQDSVAVGLGAMYASTSANVRNTAVGSQAMYTISSGTDNTAIGYNVGAALTTGSGNVLVGSSAGNNITTGAGNVCIGKKANTDTTGRNDAVVIGNGITSIATPANPHDGGLYVKHFAGAVIGNTAVFMGNELVETTSSLRYKEQIRTLEDTSDKFSKLRPVRYVGKDDQSRTEQIGLIAEEVAPLYPEFVVYTEIEGAKEPNGLAYERMVALLIREMQSMREEISTLKARLDAK